MTALPCVFMLRGVPQLQALASTQNWAATPWTTTVSRRISDLGSVGDQVLHLVFARIGNVQPGPIAGTEFGVRVRSAAWPTGLGESRWRLVPPEPGPPWFMAAQTYSFAWRETMSSSLGNGNSVELQAKVASNTAGLQASALVEDAVIVTFNLTRLASRGMGHTYVDQWSENFLLANTSEVAAGPLLTVPNAAERTFLVVACGSLSPGARNGPTQVYLRHERDGSPFARTEWLTTWAASFSADNSNTPFANKQCFTFGTVLQADPAHTDRFSLWGQDGYPYVAGQARASRASGSICAIDITQLRPDWVLHDDDPPRGRYGLSSHYGPAPNQPNHGEAFPLRISSSTGVPSLKIALSWAIPHNRHVPGITNSFTGQLALQGDQQLPAVPRDLFTGRLYVQHRTPPAVAGGSGNTGGLPDYANAQFSTGRGGWMLDLAGWFSPIHDFRDPNGEPNRVLPPFRAVMRAGAVCFVTFDAVEGAQLEVEPPTPVGAAVYIDPGREGPAVDTLPELPWAPDVGARLEQDRSGGEMITADGRTVTWGRVLRGRRRYPLSWTARNTAVADAATGTRAQWDAWLGSLSSPMVRWTAPEDVEPAAWLLLGPVKYRDLGAGNYRIEAELVELVWVDS